MYKYRFEGMELDHENSKKPQQPTEIGFRLLNQIKKLNKQKYVGRKS